jgi:hypothetical protein
MLLRVDGWHDGVVKVIARTTSSVTVETPPGSRLKVAAAGVLFPIRREVAA